MPFLSKLALIISGQAFYTVSTIQKKIATELFDDRNIGEQPVPHLDLLMKNLFDGK